MSARRPECYRSVTHNLPFLFPRNTYCVAQGTSLDNFATRDEVSALKARLDTIEAALQSVGSIASGTYVGDGKQDRVIDTGLNGTIRFVRVWLAPTIDQGPLFGGILTKIDLMAGKISDAFGAAIEGSSFTVDARFRTGSGDFNPTNLNEAGKTYIWIAIVTPQ